MRGGKCIQNVSYKQSDARCFLLDQPISGNILVVKGNVLFVI